jgi:hypothetical protein
MLKPHDIAVVLKLLETKGTSQVPTFASLALALQLSASEVHGSVKRGLEAGLLRRPLGAVRGMPVPASAALAEFLVHGVKYMWPTKTGGLGRGVATGSSLASVADALNLAKPEVALVWPHPQGSLRGETVKPLYPNAPDVALKDPYMHEWLALVDLLRLKTGREASLAAAHIRDKLT